MKKLNISLVGIVIVCLGHAIDAQAQLEFSTSEIYTCSYVNGSDYDDFSGAVRNWNRWMDEHNLTAYTGVALQPYYFSDALGADLVWLGGWTSGTAEGEHVSAWISDADAVIEGFNRVVECPAHSRWAMAELNPFDSEPGAGTTGMAEFRNCTLKENRTLNDAVAAFNEWFDFEAGLGVDTGHLMLVPIAGLASDDTYDFKWVIGFRSYAAYGAAADPMIQRGGAGRFDQIFENVMTCDSPRVYSMELERVSDQNQVSP
jgi:hypothetical protein